MSVVKVDSVVNLKLNMPRIISKVENDKFGLWLAKEWKGLIDPFTPHRNGMLERNVTYNPFEITYNEPYARYMYGGIIYGPNIPVDINGNFVFPYDPTKVVGWVSPKHKHPTGRRFNYSKDPNPRATDHWDKAAEQAGQKEKLIQSANKYLRRL